MTRKFYYVEKDYLNHLRYGHKPDKKIMLHGLDNYKNEKFCFGVVLNEKITGGKKYFSPISSMNSEKEKRMIKDGELTDDFKKFVYPIKIKKDGVKKICAILRFDCMFPVPDTELKEMSNEKLTGDSLIMKEYRYCTSAQAIKDINELSEKVYLNTVNKIDKYDKYFCDFINLEKKHDKWIKGHVSKFDKTTYEKKRTLELLHYKKK